MAKVKIRLLAMDVDGTFTDGGIYISSDGVETKRYDVKDGLAVVTFRKEGGIVAFISGRKSESTALRAKELKVDYLYNGVGSKLPVLKELASSLKIEREEVLYIGDDLNDVDCIEWAGIGVSVSDGVSKARASADWITSRPGGKGAVREVVDRIISEGLI